VSHEDPSGHFISIRKPTTIYTPPKKNNLLTKTISNFEKSLKTTSKAIAASASLATAVSMSITGGAKSSIFLKKTASMVNKVVTTGVNNAIKQNKGSMFSEWVRRQSEKSKEKCEQEKATKLAADASKASNGKGNSASVIAIPGSSTWLNVIAEGVLGSSLLSASGSSAGWFIFGAIPVPVDDIYQKVIEENKDKIGSIIEGYSADKEAGEAVENINENGKNHILQEHHNWNKFTQNPKDPNNWDEIAGIIATAIANGAEKIYKNGPAFIKSLNIDGKIVEVTYIIKDGIKIISDAWVK
jgi:Bacterial toxin 35